MGNAYSSYLITDLLRETYQYDEVVCTDWAITDDEPEKMTDLFPGGRSWGVEEGYTVSERHKLLLEAGVDQFGGNNNPVPLLEAYELMKKELGEAATLQRLQESASRILKNMFQLGLFENPYVDASLANKIVGQETFVQAGLEAQKKSIVLLKNKKKILPLANKTKVYIPKRTFPEKHDWFGNKQEESQADFVHLETVGEYLEIVDSPEQADVAYVKIKSPERDFLYHNGYSEKDKEAGGNGFMPISLQYRPYKAEYAREKSIAGDERKQDVLNRSYKGKDTYTVNETDLDLILETKRKMGEKPVVVVVQTANPFVVSEFEKEVDALLLEFGVSEQAICSILTGETEPSGCLPIQLPKDMKTVEEQFEDTPFDMEPYTDEKGNQYDFGFGLNYSGVIEDERVKNYRK